MTNTTSWRSCERRNVKRVSWEVNEWPVPPNKLRGRIGCAGFSQSNVQTHIVQTKCNSCHERALDNARYEFSCEIYALRLLSSYRFFHFYPPPDFSPVFIDCKNIQLWFISFRSLFPHSDDFCSFVFFILLFFIFMVISFFFLSFFLCFFLSVSFWSGQQFLLLCLLTIDLQNIRRKNYYYRTESYFNLWTEMLMRYYFVAKVYTFYDKVNIFEQTKFII